MAGRLDHEATNVALRPPLDLPVRVFGRMSTEAGNFLMTLGPDTRCKGRPPGLGTCVGVGSRGRPGDRDLRH